MKTHPYEEQNIKEYVEMEANEEKVEHLEKIASEYVMGEKHDIWDVHTNKNRWWVITNPTNLYLQEKFLQSMDYALTFHIGIGIRLMDNRQPRAKDHEIFKLQGAWRRWSQAADDLDTADEVEEFQAIGVKCRAALLAIAKDLAKDEMVPKGEAIPKKGDFIHWSNYIANSIAIGSGSAKIRGYLKNTSQSVWELASWLVHATNATRSDAEFVVRTTENLLFSFSNAIFRSENKAPLKCPSCGSYKLSHHYKSNVIGKKAYVIYCEVCDWEDIDPPKNLK